VLDAFGRRGHWAQDALYRHATRASLHPVGPPPPAAPRAACLVLAGLGALLAAATAVVLALLLLMTAARGPTLTPCLTAALVLLAL
jgi:hypothetical protein